VDAPTAVHSLWNAVPSGVQKRVQGAGPARRPAFRSDPGHEGYADTLDGFAVPGFPGLVCDEQAFHYLLEIERRRSDSAQRPFLLMLIDCADATDGVIPASVPGIERLFPIVCQSVRETDFVGWYRQGAVIGATLTQDGRRGTRRTSGIVRERVVKALHLDLPSQLASQPRLRIYEVLGDDELRIE